MERNISEVIRERIKNGGGRYFSNDNISGFIETEEEVERLVDEVACQFQGVLNSLIIDTDNDHNTQDTARRVATREGPVLLPGNWPSGILGVSFIDWPRVAR